jgi:hypothetical protein
VLQSLFVVINFILSPFKALAELLFYIVTFQWGKISSISIMSIDSLFSQLSAIWSQAWVSAATSATPEFTLEDPDLTGLEDEFGTSFYGGNTTVQQQPDIYLYLTVQGNVIGAGGLVEVGELTARSITEYIGVGGKPTWLEV